MEFAPPSFIQTWLQQYSRVCLPFSAHLHFLQSHLFPIGVVLTCNDSRRDLSQDFAEFQGIVSVNDFLASCRAPKTFASFFEFSCEVFVLHEYARIHWVAKFCTHDLHIGDCFEIRNCHWGPCDCCDQVTQIFQHEVRLPPLRLLHEALLILVLLQISQFRVFGEIE